MLALGAVAMFFGALLFAYAFLRSAAPSWPPPGLPLLPRLLPTAGAILLATASVWLETADGLRRRAAGALGLGVLFCAVQLLLWRILIAAGFGAAGTGAYGAIFWALTLAHVAHVGVGIYGLAATVRAPSVLRLSLWTKYWHLLFGIWAAIVVLVFWI